MYGSPILVVAVALFLASILLERLLEFLAAKRRQSARRRTITAPPEQALAPWADHGGASAASQAASLAGDADGGLPASGGERGPDRQSFYEG